MSHPDRTAFAYVAAILAALTISGAGVQAQEPSYRLVEGWAQLPDGVDAWGQTISVELDADDNLWVFHRCFAGNCIGRDNVPPILKYDPSGRLLESWGEGMFVWPHGLFVDVDGNLWTTDARGADGKGQQVIKFSPDGTVLMTLGTAGVAGEGPNTFSGPADVAVAPNGDVFVADGHVNSRIVKYSKDGEFIHCLAFDSRGRLFVGDRVNEVRRTLRDPYPSSPMP